MKTARIILAGAAMALCSLQAHAADINILKKDGTTEVAKSVRRVADNIFATVELPAKPGEPVQTGEKGIPVSEIQKIDFPEPTVLKSVPDMLVQGKAEDALRQLEKVYAFYEGFRDAPGSWWPDLALLRMQALLAAGHEKEVEEIADTLVRVGNSAEVQRIGRVMGAASTLRRGSPEAAVEAMDKILKESGKNAVLAAAAIFRGNAFLDLKDWDNALLCFLQIPVLYPEQKGQMPAYLLGAGRAYFGMEDFGKAKEILNELIKTYASSPAAASAKLELEAIEKREKALAMPN